MGTGVIFGVLVVGCLAYVVPWFIARRGQAIAPDEEDERFASSMTLIRRGTSAFADSEDPLLEVSTPMTRRAALSEVASSHRRAAVRRRRILVFLLLATAALGAVAGFTSLVPWWSLAIPGGLTVAFLLLARYSVKTLGRHLDERVESVTAGWEDDTISFEIPDELRDHRGEVSVELTVPEASGSLWDPIPVTQPTYVSKPLAPRTVRTIDLSVPMPAIAPVTAETAVTSQDEAGRDEAGRDEAGRDDDGRDELPRAVNG